MSRLRSGFQNPYSAPNISPSNIWPKIIKAALTSRLFLSSPGVTFRNTMIDFQAGFFYKEGPRRRFQNRGKMEEKTEKMSRDQVFLEVASNMVKFYSMMGHCLRFINEEDIKEQMPLEELVRHFKETQQALDSRLAENPVVKGKFEKDYRVTLKLLEGLENTGKDRPAGKSEKEEALRLQVYAREKAASLSDIVAVLRRL